MNSVYNIKFWNCLFRTSFKFSGYAQFNEDVVFIEPQHYNKDFIDVLLSIYVKLK